MGVVVKDGLQDDIELGKVSCVLVLVVDAAQVLGLKAEGTLGIADGPVLDDDGEVVFGAGGAAFVAAVGQLDHLHGRAAKWFST